MTENREIVDVENREVTLVPKFRRPQNHRRIARLKQAVFFLSLSLGASVMLNIVLLLRR